MTNEEMQNTIHFILNQQAQITINMDKFGERLDSLGEKVDKIAEAQVAYERRTSRLEESFQVLVQVAANMDGRMDTLSINTDKRIDAFERRTGRLEESFQMLVQLAANMDGRMDTSSANTDRRMDALTAAQERTDQQLARTNQQLAETDKQLARTDRQLAQTDSKLNALIDTVERYVSQGRNGAS
jgi:chromosome segregation ATPase